MKKSVRKLLSVLISIFGTFMMIYIAGYLMFLEPIRQLYIAFTEDTLTASLLFTSLIKLFFCATMGGAIWCIFDIIAGLFRDEDREE